MRRVASARPTEERVLRVARLAVDLDRHTVAVDETPVECTPAGFAILAAMAAWPERVFTRPQLLEHTRGIDRESTNLAIDTHIMNLRREVELRVEGVNPIPAHRIHHIGTHSAFLPLAAAPMRRWPDSCLLPMDGSRDEPVHPRP